jgi:hypothetical protein
MQLLWQQYTLSEVAKRVVVVAKQAHLHGVESPKRQDCYK